MIRRLLRALRPSPSPPAPAAPPPCPGPPHADAATLRRWRSAGTPALCLDLRPPAVLRYGLVRGAWLVEATCLSDPRLPADRPLVVLGDADVAAPLWVTWGGLRAWEQAGYALSEPAWKSPLPLRHPVRLTEAAARRLAVAPPAIGAVQDVQWVGDGFVYAALLEDGAGALRWLEGLDEEDLDAVGGRGAAGLGVQS